MPKYPGRIISATPPTVSLSGASGVWTLEEALQYQQAGTWPVAVNPVVADPNFNQTVLLLHGDGTNGAQNNTFLDGSTNNFTITRNGNTTQGTFSPFSGPNGYWSNYFDGTNDRLTIADNAALRPGTSAFTIEAWVYRAAAGAAHTIFAKGASTPTGFAFLITSSDTLRFTDTSTDITSTGTVAANTWVHVAAVREGTGSNQLKLYINGVQDGTGTSSSDFTQTEEARIGENRGATDDFNGYISNFRYVIGTALYTTAFTPSTSPLTTTSQGATSSEVELLTCQSNRFLDNSTNAFTVTPVNNARVTPFSPFAPSAAYDPAVNGGSGYFDGTGDYLSIASATALNLATGAFTLEGWIYPSANLVHLFSRRSAATARGLILAYGNVTNNKFSFLAGDTSTGAWEVNITSTDTFPFNAWYHVAITRDSSNNFTLWVNGTSQATTNSNVTIADDASNLLIGGIDNTGSMNGYLSNLRLVKGRAVYTSAFTPPTAPLGTTAGGQDPPQGTETSLLLNFTNAGILDNTGKNNLETVGNAQIDTTTKKYGTGSMEFDGTGDYLTLPSTIDVAFGTGNFTIEMWARFAVSTVGNGQGLFQLSNGYLNSQVRGPAAGCDNSTGRWAIYHGTSQTTHGSLVPSTNTWYHVAYVRNSGTTKLYIDGTEIISVADTTNYTDTNFTIGGWYSSGYLLNGFIDDLRITKGVARYTTTFTPPVQAFSDF